MTKPFDQRHMVREVQSVPSRLKANVRPLVSHDRLTRNSLLAMARLGSSILGRLAALNLMGSPQPNSSHTNSPLSNMHRNIHSNTSNISRLYSNSMLRHSPSLQLQ